MAASSLIYAYPQWFWLVPAAVPLGAALWFASRYFAQRRLAAFYSSAYAAQAMSTTDWKAKLARFVVIVIALSLFAAALARPLTGPKSDSGERQGANIVIVLDVSKSMWVQDVEPNRLEAVKKGLREWVRQNAGDRIGLVLFAGDAFVQAPLTSDHAALDFVLADASPKAISRKGSNIPTALETAAAMLTREKLQSKVIIIVSDGENLEGDAIGAARLARQVSGVTIFTVGVGTSSGGRVPAYDLAIGPTSTESHRPPFVLNQYGSEVTSRLDVQALRAIATEGGGTYHPFNPDEATFKQIRDRNITSLLEKTRKIDTKDYYEWFQIPLGLGILLLVFEPLLLSFRRRTAPRQVGVAVVQPTDYSPTRPRIAAANRPKASAAVLALLLLFAFSSTLTAAPSYLIEAEKLLDNGKAAEAVDQLRDLVEKTPADSYLNYNYGLALYRAGRGEEAATVFEGVQAAASDEKLKAQALFQIGNIHFLHAAAMRPDAQKKLNVVRALEDAYSSYKAQLALKSSSAGKANLATTSQELEGTLLQIGAERSQVKTEKTLREAVEVYERATELNEKHRPLIAEAKARLAAELVRVAQLRDETAEKLDPKTETLSVQDFKKISAAREEVSSRLQEASELAPNDSKIKEALKEQQKKIADVLTRAARGEFAPVDQKTESFAPRDITALGDAKGKTEQALTLDPSNGAAKDLDEKIKTKQVDANLTNGELALASLRKPGGKLDKRLSEAIEASNSFSAALAVQPDNKRAKEGLAEVMGLLPALHAEVGLSALEDAKTKLGVTGENTASPDGKGKGAEEGAKPGAGADAKAGGEAKENGSAKTAGDSKAGGEAKEGAGGKGEAKPGKGKEGGAGKAKAASLRGVAATLEKAIENLGASAGLNPDAQKVKEGLQAAEALMASVREELAKLEPPALANAGEGKGEGEGQGPPQGEDGQGQGEGPGSGEGVGGGSGAGAPMYSLSKLRSKNLTGKVEGAESKRYWEKFVREW